MKITCFALAVVLLCRFGFADDPSAQKKSDVAQQKYTQAIQRANDAFWKAKIAADKQAVADLQIAEKLAKGDKAVSDTLAAAQASLEKDLKRGQKLNITGFLVSCEHAGVYGVVCTKIEKAPEKAAAKP